MSSVVSDATEAIDDGVRPPPVTPTHSPALQQQVGGDGGCDWVNSLVLNAVKWAVENERRGDDDASAGGGYDPVSTIEKLNEMIAIVASKTEEVSASDIPWHCYLSLIQLNERAKKRNPEYRDGSYRKDGTDDVDADEVRDLALGVDLAEWAYEESRSTLKRKLRSRSFELLRHDTSVEPGRVGHYIAINHAEKIALIGLKGTSTFSDLVTDCVGGTVERTLDAPFFDVDADDDDDDKHPRQRHPHPEYESCEKRKTVVVRCHEGIWTAALHMADDTEELVRNLFLPCGYQVLIAGHSLGGGTACLLGVLLRSRIPELRRSKKEEEEEKKKKKKRRRGGRRRGGNGRNGGGDGHARDGDPLRVLAVAPPPVLDHGSAVACATFCTSLVNNCDVVPRLSLSNLVILGRILVRVGDRLRERGEDPRDWMSAVAFAGGILWEDEADDDFVPLMTLEEIDDFFDEHGGGGRGGRTGSSYLSRGDSLYVPGRVVLMWSRKRPREDSKKEKEEEENNFVDAGDRNEQREDEGKEFEKRENEGEIDNAAPLPLQNDLRREETEADAQRLKEEMARFISIDAVSSHGGTRMLRQIEPEKEFLDDHRTNCYRASVAALLQKLSERERLRKDEEEENTSKSLLRYESFDEARDCFRCCLM